MELLTFSGTLYNVTAVPEPGTWATMLLGLSCIASPWLRRRRQLQ